MQNCNKILNDLDFKTLDKICVYLKINYENQNKISKINLIVKKLDEIKLNLLRDKNFLPGLYYYLDIINENEEKAIISQIDSKNWNNSLLRRVQHYGYLYEYRLGIKTKQTDIIVEPIPDFCLDIFYKCKKYLPIPIINIEKLQVIINEYQPGQGISAHIDDPSKFKNWIITVSLGSQCIMKFSNKQNQTFIEKELLSRSAYLMLGDARYKWTHEITKRKSDIINGIKKLRTRRISITFREMIN